MKAIADLVECWRADAERLAGYGDGRGAGLLEAVAGQLEDALEAAGRELLTPTEAAEWSGYSRRRLRELVAAGEMENAGERHRPLYRRGDLPVKPGRTNGGSQYDPAADARELLARGK